MISDDRASLWRGLMVATFLALSAATVAIVHGDPELALAGGSAPKLGAELVAGALVIMVAVATWRPGTVFPVLLAAVAIAWSVAEWNVPGAGVAFTAGLVFYAAWPPLLAAASLRGMDERPIGRSGIALLALAFGAGVGVLGLASAAVFDPEIQGCVQCPANLLRVIGEPGLTRALGRTGLALTAIWIGGFFVLAAMRLTRSSPARRRVAWPVLVPAVATVALYGADAVHGLDRGFLSNDPTDRALRLAEAGGLVLVAAGVGLALWRTRRTRATLARLVLELGDAPSPGELRARLADTLGDPTLQLLHRLEGGDWIDAEGRGTDLLPRDGREVTRLRVGGEEVLAIVHRPGLLDDPALVGELATTANLALQHERLHASLRAQLRELRASRSRIVAAADDPALDTALAAAEAGVRAAVVELRDVAHGLFPTVLADEGLRAALEELSEHAPRFITHGLPDGRFPGEVESAAYFAAVEALRQGESEVTVDAVVDKDRLRIVIGTGTPLDGAMTQIRDRVGAVGGTVTTRDGVLCLEMPCAS